MMENQQPEKGQALVMLVFAVVGLLGFAALAIDGGMLYSDRRHAQNAADASSLAGGGIAALNLENSHMNYNNWDCNDSRVKAAQAAGISEAISRAASNHYSIDQDIDDHHGVTAICGEVDNGNWIEKYIDIRTVITRDTQTSLVHFVYSGPTRNTVDAVTRIRPRAPLAYGHAIVALSDSCHGNEGGVNVDGSAVVKVVGGGIFSNACMVANGSVRVIAEDGDITCIGVGCYTKNGSPHVEPTPEVGTQPLPTDSTLIPAPNCSVLPARSAPAHGGTIQPGRYSSTIRVNNNEVLELRPGLYCLDRGIVVNGGGTLSGAGVTFYLTSGDFDTSGDAQVNLAGPPARNCNYCPPPIPGVLIYLAKGNDGLAFLRGTSDSDYVGTVYAPDGTIDVGGTGDSFNVHTQLIGWTVKLHGTPDIFVNFEDESNYQRPANLELFK